MASPAPEVSCNDGHGRAGPGDWWWGGQGQSAATLLNTSGAIFVAHFPVYKILSYAFSHWILPGTLNCSLLLMRQPETWSLSDLPKVTLLVTHQNWNPVSPCFSHTIHCSYDKNVMAGILFGSLLFLKLFYI